MEHQVKTLNIHSKEASGGARERAQVTYKGKHTRKTADGHWTPEEPGAMRPQKTTDAKPDYFTQQSNLP